jgi:hypothetical protein
LVALLAAKGWRKGFVPPFAFLAISALHLLWPLFLFEADSVSPPQGHSTSLPVPITAALERGDSGRFDIYRAGWLAMDNLWLGTGQWGVRSLWQSHLHQSPNDMMTHLHSAFFATFVHGGIIGVGLLLALASLGLRRAWSLAVKGDATWFVLFSFGCAGLLFDGESLASLTTAPRFEGLLFWTPLIIALSKESKTSSPPSLAAPVPIASQM